MSESIRKCRPTRTLILRTVTEINECESQPCYPFGNCTDLVADYNCTCLPGFYSDNSSNQICHGESKHSVRYILHAFILKGSAIDVVQFRSISMVYVCVSIGLATTHFNTLQGR